jgi:signal transduction histidine kinase
MATSSNGLREEMILRSKCLTDGVIEEIRKLSKSLVGPRFEDIGFTQSLSDLVENIRLASPFTLSLSYSIFNEDHFIQKQKLMLYRIIQEALNNVIKYAKAKNVTIRLGEKEDCLELKIKDDGIGFDATKISKGIGLKNISSRLEFEEGKMLLLTEPGKGCEIVITIPRRQKQEAAI